MMAYRGLTNIKTLGDVLVPEPLTNQGNDLTLALREGGDLGSLGRCGRRCLWTRQLAEHTSDHAWFKPDLASAHLSDGLQQRFRSLFLQHQPHSPVTHRLPMRLRVTHPREHEYTCLGRGAQEGRDTLNGILPT